MLYIGNVKQYDTQELRDKVKRLTDIFYDKNPRGRSKERIYKDTFYGEIAENVSQIQ